MEESFKKVAQTEALISNIFIYNVLKDIKLFTEYRALYLYFLMKLFFISNNGKVENVYFINASGFGN